MELDRAGLEAAELGGERFRKCLAARRQPAGDDGGCLAGAGGAGRAGLGLSLLHISQPPEIKGILDAGFFF